MPKPLKTSKSLHATRSIILLPIAIPTLFGLELAEKIPKGKLCIEKSEFK